MSWNQTDRCNLTLMEEVEVFHKVAYIPVFALGLLLNSMALYMFILKRASRTETDIYMMNLAVADFALILFLPFRIYDNFNRLNVWYFCRILICIHYLNMYASILTLTAISVHRFVLVKFPFNARAGGVPLHSNKTAPPAVCLLKVHQAACGWVSLRFPQQGESASSSQSDHVQRLYSSQSVRHWFQPGVRLFVCAMRASVGRDVWEAVLEVRLPRRMGNGPSLVVLGGRTG
ncbi:hypothetical protein SKAU_G00303940 [Synaphobranchus kaupii]|uniref:G-protein coupled receptors family 1 profile domain-containing protein n=1 Tax=Synaphobranchus kaupii TaxID=118154 RepID=A0A9Q1EWC8_SYNKA|nr:hypothetical protein SKAU_G00303940 [Synaphobranchus kaupii]